MFYKEHKPKTTLLCPDSWCFQLTPVGSSVFIQISATDKDQGANKEIEYSIIPGDGSVVSVVDSWGKCVGCEVDRGNIEFKLKIYDDIFESCRKNQTLTILQVYEI